MKCSILNFRKTLNNLFLSASVLLALGLFGSGCGYNSMQAEEEAVKASWADVEAAYQRRMDLIRTLNKFEGQVSNCHFTKHGTQAWRI